MTVILHIISSFITIFWGGYAIAVLWGWFAVPLGVTGISAFQGAGLSALASLLLGYRAFFADMKAYQTFEEKERWFYPLYFSIFQPVIALAAGWIIRILMTA